MPCPRCHADTAPADRFCAQCGAPLSPRCPQCGTSARAGARFCSSCGARLAAAETTAAPAPVRPVPTASPASAGQEATPLRVASPSPDVSDGERRHLTVLFCDLVDSTTLATRLDPEEWREVIRTFQRACMQVIARYEGHIAQYLGDGLLAYFGYPQAHEDDAHRAVRAGLAIVDATRRLPRHLGAEVAVRIGVHTGEVVVGAVGEGASREALAVGETPNLAARLQTLAEPYMVLISAATHRLVDGAFLTRDLGDQTLKGFAAPVRVYQMLSESGIESRLEVASRHGLTPLVGREQEVGLLLDRWEQVLEGQGQVVVLSGEPGIGKSRLVQVMKERAAGGPHGRLEGRCSPYYEHTPFYPVIDLVRGLLQWSRDDPPEAKLAKLEAWLAARHLALAEVGPLFTALLSLPVPQRYPPLAMSPERQKEKTLEAVLAALLALAAERPVLLIVEDLHWSDPSTLEFLALLVDQVPAARLFVLLTARPGFRVPWPPRAHLVHLTLNRLTRKQTGLLVERVAGGKPVQGQVLQQIVTKTDGVPLFVEELTKMVLESGWLRVVDGRYELAGPLPSLAIPATLRDSLTARLDRLGTAKEVAQLSATIGRAFPYRLLRALSPLDEATLQRELARLVAAELLYPHGVPPDAIYAFKHALVQDAAYQSVLKGARQRFHEQIARALTDQFPEVAETQPELLAHHYTEAGLGREALVHWHRAGERAIERSAYIEAIGHLTKGLQLLDALPDGPERAREELALQLALGNAAQAVKGFAAVEAENAYLRARQLCNELGDSPQLFPMLHGLYRFYTVRGELQRAREVGEQLLALARRAEDPTLLLPEAHRALGVSLLWLGEVTRAREHLEQGIVHYDLKKHRSHAFRYAIDPGVVCLSYAPLALWSLGYPEQALKKGHEALALAREISHPQTLGLALVWSAWLHQLRREPQATRAQAEAGVAHCGEQGFVLWGGMGSILRGWALAELGQGGDAVAEIREGLAAIRATGAGLYRPSFLALLAEAHAKAGWIDEGLAALTEALTIVDQKQERFYEAELHRLTGELLLRRTTPSSDPAAAEQQAEMHFGRAIEIARAQQAKSLELRAVMSLSRLLQHQGRRDEARRLLAETYGWFTEGFETRDLQEAKVLFDSLA